jgi:hypothetical protein
VEHTCHSQNAIKKLNRRDEVLPPANQLHKALYTLNLLNCQEHLLKGIVLMFFLKVPNTQCGYHGGFSSLVEPLSLKMRRLRLEDLPLDRELLRLTLPPTRRWPRKWPLARQMQHSKPPMWGQIKKTNGHGDDGNW